MWGKPIKYNFVFFAAGNLGFSYNFEIFYSGREVSFAH